MCFVYERVQHKIDKEYLTSRSYFGGWRKALLLIYALFWALGLPFICFGASADPSHPHKLPHFVFSDPPSIQTNRLANRAVELAQSHDAAASFYHLYLKPQISSQDQSSSNQQESPQPVGRATLTLAIFAILTIALLGIWNLLRFDRAERLAVYSPPSPKSNVLRLQLPPPRILSFA